MSQLLGIGLFTHPYNLVNTPTWFISLLLLCYAGVFFAKVSGGPVVCGALVSLVLLVWVHLETKPWLTSHLLTFSIAATISFGIRPERIKVASLSAGCAFLIASWDQASFSYTGLALILIGAGMYPIPVPRMIHLIVEFSYEYYLIHGIFLFGMVRFMPLHPILAVTSGIALAALGAVLLKTVLDRVSGWIVLQRPKMGQNTSFPLVSPRG